MENAIKKKMHKHNLKKYCFRKKMRSWHIFLSFFKSLQLEFPPIYSAKSVHCPASNSESNLSLSVKSHRGEHKQHTLPYWIQHAHTNTCTHGLRLTPN